MQVIDSQKNVTLDFLKDFIFFQIPEDGHYRISFSGVVGSEDEGYATLILLDENANNLAVVEMGKYEYYHTQDRV